MLFRWLLGVCSIRVFAKNHGNPYYEPTIVVHDTRWMHVYSVVQYCIYMYDTAQVQGNIRLHLRPISTHPRFYTCTSGHATKVWVCHGCPWAVSYVLSFECVCVRCIVHTVFYKKFFCRSVGPYTLNSAPTLLMMLIGDTTGLPWLVYQAFVVEEYHSFNKQVSIVMCY